MQLEHVWYEAIEMFVLRSFVTAERRHVPRSSLRIFRKALKARQRAVRQAIVQYTQHTDDDVVTQRTTIANFLQLAEREAALSGKD